MISNDGLIKKCRQYVLIDPSTRVKDDVIKTALVSAFREISNLGMMPLEWNKEIYDEIFTRYYAEISAITAANPGVITCDSVDPDLSSDHGFQTNDIVYIEGVNGEDVPGRLNGRLFRAVRASATTMTLKQLDGQTAINTTDYDTYDSGGTIYHAGIVLPASTIEPSGASELDVDYEWNIKRVHDVEFDMESADPISEESAKAVSMPGGRPRRWRYQQYAYAGFASPEHLLFWYNFPSQRYNVRVHLEKEYPDPTKWTNGIYLPCPGHLHEYVWHRALSNLAIDSQKHRRVTSGDGDNTKIEILNAEYWIAKAMEEEIKILEYSRKLSGDQPHKNQGMSA